MPDFAQGYIEPGAYLQQEDISTAAVTLAQRTGALIGQGSKTLSRQETLTHSGLNSQDGPLSNNIVIDILSVYDQNNKVYTKDVDYKLTRNGDQTLVDWSLKASISGTQDLTANPNLGTELEGLGLALTVDGEFDTVIFTGVTSPANVVSQINAWFSDPTLAALDGTGKYLVLTANSIEVDPSGAVNDILGLPVGRSAATYEPAIDAVYTVVYNSDKTDAEYAPRLFMDPIKVAAYSGEAKPQTLLHSGTASGAGARVMSDSTKSWGVNTLRGCYLKITSGPGKGQVRVITDNTATQVSLSRDWTAGGTPTAASLYTITDINDNSLSKGFTVYQGAGATYGIVSQYQDDIFNTPNIKKAIDNLGGAVDGILPYSLCLMRGLGLTDIDPVNYLIAHCEKFSDRFHNQYCQFNIGLAAGNDDALAIANFAGGFDTDRGTLVNMNSLPIDFGTGEVTVDGSYLAAFHTGAICAPVAPSTPLTRRSAASVFNVSGIVDNWKREEKNFMAQKGVTVYERQGNDFLCRHARNMNDFLTATVLAQETKLTISKDAVSNLLRTRIDKAFTGSNFYQYDDGTSDIPGNIKAVLITLLEQLKSPVVKSEQVIIKYETPVVKPNAREPRQVDIAVKVWLTPDLLWEFIVVGYGVGA